MACADGAIAARMSAASAAATAVLGIARPSLCSAYAKVYSIAQNGELSRSRSRRQRRHSAVAAISKPSFDEEGRQLPPHQPPGPRGERDDRQRRPNFEIGPEADR